MTFFRRDILIFLAGFFSLGLFGRFVKRSLKGGPVDTGGKIVPDFELPETARKPPVHRLDRRAFDVDRKRKTVCARDADNGVLLWESRGEDSFIVPGAAFPIDLTPDGELWVSNVGRKRLERLDPKTGEFVAYWEPAEPFAGCCNPVRFALLPGGRVVTMEKGIRRACVYLPTGALECVVADTLSDSEFNYYLYRKDDTVVLYDAGTGKHWEIS